MLFFLTNVTLQINFKREDVAIGRTKFQKWSIQRDALTYQYLMVDMIATAKEKGGFLDQKMFKTVKMYGFDYLLAAILFRLSSLHNSVPYSSRYWDGKVCPLTAPSQNLLSSIQVWSILLWSPAELLPCKVCVLVAVFWNWSTPAQINSQLPLLSTVSGL